VAAQLAQCLGPGQALATASEPIIFSKIMIFVRIAQSQSESPNPCFENHNLLGALCGVVVMIPAISWNRLKLFKLWPEIIETFGTSA
jgi:hypothetical protein